MTFIVKFVIKSYDQDLAFDDIDFLKYDIAAIESILCVHQILLEFST